MGLGTRLDICLSTTSQLRTAVIRITRQRSKNVHRVELQSKVPFGINSHPMPMDIRKKAAANCRLPTNYNHVCAGIAGNRT